MDCHRCHQALVEDATFCPHCGAAQLYVTPEMAENPYEVPLAVAPMQRIDWKAALRACLIVSAVAAVLSALSAVRPVLGVASFLWILTASTTTLWLYLRAKPGTVMDGRIGARIGLTVGLVLSLLTTVSSGAALVVQRYLFHQAAVIDAQFAAMMTQLAQLYNTMGIDQTTQQSVFSLMRSPEGQAGQMLSTYVSRAVEICIFLMLTGAVSGMMRATSRRRAQ